MTEKASLMKVYSTFGEVAKALGYSPIHGRIMAALAANKGELSLTNLAKETGYSASMVSISLDLLEMMGIVKKARKHGDRNLYVALQGDLLETFKNALVFRIGKSITNTLKDFDASKKQISTMRGPEGKRLKESIVLLETEIKRLEQYMRILASVRLP